MRNNKGVTLVALVITIIVLLILAGVSLAMLTGENGILTNASQAKKDTLKANYTSAVDMTYMELKTEFHAGKTMSTTAMETVASHYMSANEGTYSAAAGDETGDFVLTFTPAANVESTGYTITWDAVTGPAAPAVVND